MADFNQDHTRTLIPGLRPTRAVMLLTLGILLLLGLIFTASAAPLADTVFGAGSRDALLAQSVLQAVCSFILPAWICVKIFSKDAGKALGLTTPPRAAALLSTLVCMMVAVPLLNEIISLNASMKLPEATDALFRQWEKTSAEITARMLATDSVGGLISGILVVGVLTGFAEELFFRGALQPMLRGEGMGAQGAIWLAAVVFSIMHFQPFGFFPRLLLGAFFGYLYAWSGSIWLSASAHALNNSLVVLVTWLSRRGADTSFYETAGTPESGTLWLAAVSAVATAAAVYYSSRIIKQRH